MAFCAAIYTPQMYSTIGQEYANGDGGGRALEGEENQNANYQAPDISISQIVSIVSISGIVGLVLSTLALGFMMRFAEGLIKVALWFNIILSGVMAISALMAGVIPMALLCLFGFAMTCYYAYCVWSRIPFAASNLVTAVTAIRANLGVAVFAYISLALTFLWTLMWATASTSTMFVVSECDAQGQCQNTGSSGFLTFLFLVSFFWTSQVLKNVVHVTVAGTVGTWWFAPLEASSCCSKAVTDSWFRSITYNFGSICLGSLIVAIIQAIREILKQMREQDDSIMVCIAECILGCIESLVEYFNTWAFTYVGLYGYSFIDAGKNVIQLFQQRGWTAIIADTLVDSVLSMVSLGVGALTGIVGILVAQGSGVDLSGGVVALPFFVGFLLGFALCSTLFSVVGSAVNTVIVCYAEAPNEFQANHPELSNQMRATWRQAYPNDFNY